MRVASRRPFWLCQAAVWLLAGRDSFCLSELEETLRTAGFEGLELDPVNEIAQALQLSGVCRREGDRFSFSIPLAPQAEQAWHLPPPDKE